MGRIGNIDCRRVDQRDTREVDSAIGTGGVETGKIVDGRVDIGAIAPSGSHRAGYAAQGEARQVGVALNVDADLGECTVHFDRVDDHRPDRIVDIIGGLFEPGDLDRRVGCAGCIVDGDVLDRRVAAILEQHDVAIAIAAAVAIVGEARSRNRDLSDAVRLAVDEHAVLRIAAERGVQDLQMTERYRPGGRHAVGAALEADPVDRHGAGSDIAGHGEARAARRIDDDACRAAHSDQRDCLIDDHVFGIDAFRDQDGVAIHGRIDCVLDGGETAIADQQEATRCSPHRIRAFDNLHAGQRVGAFTEAVGIDLPARDAGTVGIGIRDGAEVPDRQLAIVDGGIRAAAADQRVVAGAALERVIADLARGAASWLVGAIELVVTVAAAKRVVAALAHDPVIAGCAGDGLIDRRLAGLVALDFRVDIRTGRQRDGEARHVDLQVCDAVDVEQRPPVADSARQVEVGDGKTVDLAEVEDRNRVLVIGPGNRHVIEHDGADVRRGERCRGVAAAIVHVTGDFDGIVGPVVLGRGRRCALERHALKQGIALVAKQLDVGRALVVVLEAVVGEIRVHNFQRSDAGNDRRIAVIVRIIANEIDSVLRIAADLAVHDRQLAGIGRGLDKDAVGAANQIDVVDRHVSATQIAGQRHRRARGRVDRDCPDADKGQRLGHGQILGIGAFRDQDGVAIHGRIDCVLDGGETAIADQQEATRCSPHRIRAFDNLHAGQRVGAFTEAVGIDLPARDAGTVGIGIRDGAEVPDRQLAIVDGGIRAAAADQRVVAGAALERVIADLARGAASWLVGAIELVVTVAAAKRVVAALAHDPVIAGCAGDGLIDRRLAGLVALDFRVDIRTGRQRDGEARHVDLQVCDAVDVEQRPPVADSARQVEVGDGKTVDLAEVEDRNRVLVIGPGNRHVIEHDGADVRRGERCRGVAAAIVHVTGDFDGIVGPVVLGRGRRCALERHALKQGIALVAKQLDVGRALVVVLEAVVGEIRVHNFQRSDAGNDRRIAVIVRIIANEIDSVLRIAADLAVHDRQLAGIGRGLDKDAVGAANQIDVVDRHVSATQIAGQRHRRARGRVDRDRPDADKGQRLGDGQILGVGAGVDLDRVAVERRACIDCRLDRGISADQVSGAVVHHDISCQVEIDAVAAEVDAFNAVERVDLAGIFRCSGLRCHLPGVEHCVVADIVLTLRSAIDGHVVLAGLGELVVGN